MAQTEDRVAHVTLDAHLPGEQDHELPAVVALTQHDIVGCVGAPDEPARQLVEHPLLEVAQQLEVREIRDGDAGLRRRC